jgi:acetyltransferase-like isoleucine patch superfamily enzyme
MTTDTPVLFDLVPGVALTGDWHTGKVPDNIIAGPNTKIDSAACFKAYRSKGVLGLRTGANVTLWGPAFAVEGNGCIEIGDDSYVLGALFTCTQGISIGHRVFIATGVTLSDSDFHPVAPGTRLFDTIAISPVGDRTRRPPFGAGPIVIEDDVWIGYNATILKGVRIGAGAVVFPGAVVTRDVPPHTRVAGNPATPVPEDMS